MQATVDWLNPSTHTAVPSQQLVTSLLRHCQDPHDLAALQPVVHPCHPRIGLAPASTQGAGCQLGLHPLRGLDDQAHAEMGAAKVGVGARQTCNKQNGSLIVQADLLQ